MGKDGMVQTTEAMIVAQNGQPSNSGKEEGNIAAAIHDSAWPHIANDDAAAVPAPAAHVSALPSAGSIDDHPLVAQSPSTIRPTTGAFEQEPWAWADAAGVPPQLPAFR